MKCIRKFPEFAGYTITIQEAIEILKNERPGCGEKAIYTEGRKCEAYDIAISALEKQLPKEREIKGGIPHCPVCGEIAKTDTGNSFADYWLSFCNKCGQKLGSDK